MLKRVTISILALVTLVAAQAPGNYAGTWAGSSGGGKLTLGFGDGGLTTASFTYQGQDVKSKPISSKADGNIVEFTFEYDLGGTSLRSSMMGTVDGKSIKGKYKSAPAIGGAPVDEGTWEVTQQ